jgi:mono/diheme cytochrome c family protein
LPTLLLALLCAGPVADATGAEAAAAVPGDAAVQRGAYLARAGDCISCHTRPGGLPFAGGLAMATPFGSIVSTNITPQPEQGIGRYSAQDFAQALRQGRARDGHFLYPAMPYTHFALLSDADVGDLYAFFMRGVAPAVQDNATTRLPWPFSMRWLMAAWNTLYLRDARYAPVASQSAQWNRGAYLVQGAGHCGACHTPRGWSGAEQAGNEADGTQFLAGARIDGWYAQPLRHLEGAASPCLAAWSAPELADYLQTGRSTHSAAFGAMVDVVGNSTQYLLREDLLAMAQYLKSLGVVAGANPTVERQPANPADPTTLALRAGDAAGLADRRGALVYLNNCSACHRSDGEGANRTFPALARSSSVAAADPTSLIRIVLAGSAMPHTGTAPSALAMPALGWRLSNENIADVLVFVRRSWGNQAAAVTLADVAAVRAALPRPETLAPVAPVPTPQR